MNPEIKTSMHTEKTLASGLSIIPQPEFLERREGTFVLDADTVLVADACTAAAAAALANAIRPAAGFIAKVVATTPEVGSAVVFLLDSVLTDLGAEGYRLEVTPARVTLVAPTQAGLFYAVQTLRQLLPPEIFSADPVRGTAWHVSCVAIVDRPRFAWRGLMLDTGHDYQRLSYIFRFIDLMALHKFNVLHWHICDLGTFPLEIRGYPKLQNPETLTVRLRGPEKRPVKPGSYTQDEARAVVAYAAARHITVLPEIDMPGHSTPVLLAYPEFDCPVPHKQYGDFDHWEYCLSNEKAMAFLEEVLTQVMAIFPSAYIHIGGDECPIAHWEKCPVCQARIKADGLADEEEMRRIFLQRIERFLASRGRRMIGWDEVYKNEMAPQTTIMIWHPDFELAASAAVAGHDVIMAPHSHLYFDLSEEKTPIDKVYAFEPVPPQLNPDQAAHILGAQAQLWTDHHPSEAEIDRLVYPRACAFAEVVWSEPDRRDWTDFSHRLHIHAQRLAALDIIIPLPERCCGG